MASTDFSLPNAPGAANPASFGALLSLAIPSVFALAGLGLLLMIVRAGFTLLMSAGDAKKMEAGKQQLTYAIVGFLIIFSSFWIVRIAGTLLGIREAQNLFQ